MAVSTTFVQMIAIATVIAVIGLTAAISDDCLTCICQRNDCEKRLGKKTTDGVCGPFYISNQYYVDCDSPGDGWESCCQNMTCSRQCVRTYMDKYAVNCTYPKEPTCKDYTRMHWGQSRTGCRTDNYVLRESNIASAWTYVGSCCELTGTCEERQEGKEFTLGPE